MAQSLRTEGAPAARPQPLPNRAGGREDAASE